MEKSNKNISDLIKELAKRDSQEYSLAAKVLRYDQESETIDVEPVNGDADVLSVRLLAGETETPFLVVPAVDSIVLVTFLSRETAFVSMFSEIETIKIRGDQYGGLIKIEELVNQLGVMTARIDALYDAINNGVPIPQDGGAGLQNSMKAIIAGKAVEDFSGIENENIVHG